MTDVTIKELIAFSSLLITIGSVYWKLVVRIVKLESTKNDLSKKVDSLILSVEALKSLIGEHIAYHKGKEEK